MPGVVRDGWVVGDRYVVTHGQDAHVVTILDTKVMRARRVTLPDHCVVDQQPVEPTSEMRASSCDGAGGQPSMIEPATLTVRHVHLPSGAWGDWGRQWVWDGGRTYLNRISGETRTNAVPPQLGFGTVIRSPLDLNAPALTSYRFCRPFRAQRKYSAAQQRHDRVIWADDRSTVFAARCGSARSVRAISRPGAATRGLSLLGGWAALLRLLPYCFGRGFDKVDVLLLQQCGVGAVARNDCPS